MTLLLRTPLVLDAATRIAVASGLVATHPPATPVVLVVRDGLARRYYTTTVRSLTARLEQLPKTKRIADTLDPEGAAATMQFSASNRDKLATFSGVLLDGYQVYAVVGEPGRAAPKGSRGGARAAPPPRAAAPPMPQAAPMPAPTVSAGAAPQTDRLTAHAFVSAPDVVREEDSFDVTIGLAAQAMTGVDGGPMSIDYARGTTSITLDVQVAASGFSAPQGWRRKLVVDTGTPYDARCTVRLTAQRLPAEEEDPSVSLLMVHYSYNGVPCGVAIRRVAIQRRSAARVTSTATDTAAMASSVVVNAGADADRADVVMRIAPRDDVSSGEFVLTFDPSPDLTLPPDPFPVSLGKDPASFARSLIDEVTAHDAQPSLSGTLSGQGVRIADQIPAVAWNALRDAANAVRGRTGRLPTLLLLAGEAHVPWELARFPDPVPDTALPPFLSAQFAMARWILSPNVPPVPSARHAIDHIAVVTGQYSRFGRMEDLPFANRERQFLMASYVDETIPLRADDLELSQLVAAKIPIENGVMCGAELVHFALHGDVTADTPPAAVLYLSNGRTFSSTMFLDSALGKGCKPFVFLNACKAGAPVTQLGDYAGFAGDCLRAGFSGMLAPLWSVEDDLAHEVAKEFYEAALSPNGECKRVGEVMAAIRAKYIAAPELGRHSTYMAYVYYGHPNLVMSRT
jgi:hypothetical protein